MKLYVVFKGDYDQKGRVLSTLKYELNNRKHVRCIIKKGGIIAAQNVVVNDHADVEVNERINHEFVLWDLKNNSVETIYSAFKPLLIINFVEIKNERKYKEDLFIQQTENWANVYDKIIDAIDGLMEDINNPQKLNVRYNLLNFSDKDKDYAYRVLWKEYVIKDVKDVMERDDEFSSMNEGDIDIVADRFVFEGEYDCNRSYWDNIESLCREQIEYNKD